MKRELEEKLTREEVAGRLKVSPRTVDRYRAAGLLRAQYLPGGAVRFSARAVENMLQESSRRRRLFFTSEAQA